MVLIFLHHNRDSGMPAEEQNLLRTCAGCGAGPRVKFHVTAHTYWYGIFLTFGGTETTHTYSKPLTALVYIGKQTMIPPS